MSTTQSPTATADATAIRQFEVNVPEAELEDLRRRIQATRWPEKEPVDDLSQGVQFAAIAGTRALLGDGVRLRPARGEAERPAAVHDRDRRPRHPLHPRALAARRRAAAIITHGWPGSIVEMLNVIGPLADPTAHGGSAEDAFHVVVPSMPGYGFSGKPDETGWDFPSTSRAPGRS